jgi:CDP-diacylglycerol--serine O-phosphatidyltransferase
LASLASVFTIGRLVCGFLAIVLTFKGMSQISAPTDSSHGLLAFDGAASAIFWGILCDCLDGVVARLTGRASDFGREMDSLVDILTFGMAPALLGLFWGVVPVQRTLDRMPGELLNVAGALVANAFLVCGVARLARYNLMAEQAKGDANQAVGLAIPGAAAVLAAVITG